MATLQLDGLRKSYGDVAILHGIDLTLSHGEMLVIVGASGCGKSTLLRLVAGLETATDGHILLDGKDVTHLTRRRGTSRWCSRTTRSIRT
ncbi:MAG: ATP-binding cassette domain-containing protein [Acetobacteraceae bacterium]